MLASISNFVQFVFYNFVIANIINNHFKKLFSDFITIRKLYKFLHHISICIFHFKKNKLNKLFLKVIKYEPNISTL